MLPTYMTPMTSWWTSTRGEAGNALGAFNLISVGAGFPCPMGETTSPLQSVLNAPE
jgi:hypothetical protein